MSPLQGSLHRQTNGIGFGACVPSNKGYYNLQTPKERRPTSESLRCYRSSNVTAGIDTHRSDLSFGKPTDNVAHGLEGDMRAMLSTEKLTSGEVGSFFWQNLGPCANRRTDNSGDSIAGETLTTRDSMSARGAAAAPGPRPAKLTPRTPRQPGQTPGREVAPGRVPRLPSGRSGSPPRSQRPPSAQNVRGSSPGPPKADRSARSSSVKSSARSSVTASSQASRAPSGSARSTVSGVEATATATSRSSSSRSSYSSRPSGRISPFARGGIEAISASGGGGGGGPPSLASRWNKLDPAFERHKRFDLLAATSTGPLTTRFGPVDSSAIISQSQLTSELSTPWLLGLRSQK